MAADGEGLSRRRGRPRSKPGTGLPKIFVFLAAVIFVLFIITWMIITQKTTKSLNEIEEEMKAEARNLGAMMMIPNGDGGREDKLLRSMKEEADEEDEEEEEEEKRRKQQQEQEERDYRQDYHDNVLTPPGTSLVECVVSTFTPWEPGTPTANGALKITVRHDLAPTASRIFMDMVKAKYFDENYLFRVIKNFIAQWGIRHKEIMDTVHLPKPTGNLKDPITDQSLKNVRGTMSFAGGNPGNQQVFINLRDNPNIDKENSRPFATVDDAGMEVMNKLYTGYEAGQGQVTALNLGVEAINYKFPYWSKIVLCEVLAENHHEEETTKEE